MTSCYRTAEYEVIFTSERKNARIAIVVVGIELEFLFIGITFDVINILVLYNVIFTKNRIDECRKRSLLGNAPYMIDIISYFSKHLCTLKVKFFYP